LEELDRLSGLDFFGRLFRKILADGKEHIEIAENRLADIRQGRFYV
jgi:hypothetical protein